MVRQYTTFFIGDGLYGADVLLVSEINRNLDITEVSPAPEYVRGLINLRGQIVTVMDPGVRFGIGRRVLSGGSCCIVMKNSDEIARITNDNSVEAAVSRDTVAVLVDRIGDMVDIDDSDIERPPANVNGVDAAYFTGIVKLDGTLLTIVNIAKLIFSNQQ